MKYLHHYQMDCGAWRMHPWWPKVITVFLVMLSKNVNIIIVRCWCPNMQGYFLCFCVFGPSHICKEISGQRKSTFMSGRAETEIFVNYDRRWLESLEIVQWDLCWLFDLVDQLLWSVKMQKLVLQPNNPGSSTPPQGSTSLRAGLQVIDAEALKLGSLASLREEHCRDFLSGNNEVAVSFPFLIGPYQWSIIGKCELGVCVMILEGF